MKESLELKISYEGQLHQVDVDTLIISLLHLAEMLKMASEKIMIPGELFIKINAPERGSFSIFLEIARKLSGLFYSIDLDSIGKVVKTIIDIFTLKKILKGEKPDRTIKTQNNSVIIEKGDSRLEVPLEVYKLYSENPGINNHIETIFGKLVENPEVEGLLLESKKAGRFYASSNEFSTMAKNNELIEEEQTQEIVKDAKVSVVKLVFQRNRKGEFIYNGIKISAYITDENFWRQVDQGISFSKGDIMSVDLLVTKIFDKEYNCFVNRSFEVVKVIEYYPRHEQQTIDY